MLRCHSDVDLTAKAFEITFITKARQFILEIKRMKNPISNLVNMSNDDEHVVNEW